MNPAHSTHSGCTPESTGPKADQKIKKIHLEKVDSSLLLPQLPISSPDQAPLSNPSHPKNVHKLPPLPNPPFQTLKLPQSIINHIPPKRRPGPKHRRIPKLHRHILDPLMMSRILRVGGMGRILRLLCHDAGVELLLRVGVVARVDVV